MDTGGLNSYPDESKTNKYPNKELLPPDPRYVITIITFVHVITYSHAEKYFSPYQVFYISCRDVVTFELDNTGSQCMTQCI